MELQELEGRCHVAEDGVLWDDVADVVGLKVGLVAVAGFAAVTCHGHIQIPCRILG